MFRILDKHIFRQLLAPFVFGLLGALIIIAFGPMHRAIKFLVAGTVPPRIILEWFLFRVPEDMQFIFPVATLMASLLGFARLSRDGELTAMRSSGISLLRLLVPVIAFGLAATGATYLFLNRFVPPAMVHSQDLWVEHFRKTQPPTFKENFTLRTRGSRLLSVGQVNLRDPELLKLMLREYAPEGSRLLRQLSAPRAEWDPEARVWVLEDAREEIYGEGKAEVEVRRHPSFVLDLEEPPEVFQAQERSPQELTPEQLLERIRDIESRGLANTLELRVELYLKFSFPFCVLIFAILGATMGITNARSGGFLGFGIACILTFLYYVSMSLAASMGKSGAVDPVLSAWIHNIVFLAITFLRALRASGS